MDVFGAEKFERLDGVVRRIADEQNVTLDTFLADYWPHAEVLPSDYGWMGSFRGPPKYANQWKMFWSL